MKNLKNQIPHIGRMTMAAFCLVFALTITPQRLLAQTALWNVANAELRNDNMEFVVTFERSTLSERQRNDARVKKMLAIIRSDSALLTYQPENGTPFETVAVELDNKKGADIFLSLIADFEKASDEQKRRAASHLLLMGDEGQTVKSFSSALGNFNVSYEVEKDDPLVGNGHYGGYIKLISKDGDHEKYRAIIEPTALKQAIESVGNLRQMQQDAILAKQKQLAEEKVLREKKAQNEIARAKAESDERLKKEEVESQKQQVQAQVEIARAKTESAERLKRLEIEGQEKLTELEKQKKLQDIRDAEIAARNQKALAYMSSSEGKALSEQIQSQYEKFITQQKKEGAYLKDYDDRVDALTKTVTDPRISLLDVEIANEQLRQAIAARGMAARHEDSPELQKMRQDLQILFARFKANAGMGYDDTMKLSQAAASKKQ